MLIFTSVSFKLAQEFYIYSRKFYIFEQAINHELDVLYKRLYILQMQHELSYLVTSIILKL